MSKNESQRHERKLQELKKIITENESNTEENLLERLQNSIYQHMANAAKKEGRFSDEARKLLGLGPRDAQRAPTKLKDYFKAAVLKK